MTGQLWVKLKGEVGMKKCGICGKNLNETDRYCHYCGNDTYYDWISTY